MAFARIGSVICRLTSVGQSNVLLSRLMCARGVGVIADPVVFETERRFSVLERSIATSSPHMRGGEIARQGDDWPVDAVLEADCRWVRGAG